MSLISKVPDDGEILKSAPSLLEAAKELVNQQFTKSEEISEEDPSRLASKRIRASNSKHDRALGKDPVGVFGKTRTDDQRLKIIAKKGQTLHVQPVDKDGKTIGAGRNIHSSHFLKEDTVY